MDHWFSPVCRKKLFRTWTPGLVHRFYACLGQMEHHSNTVSEYYKSVARASVINGRKSVKPVWGVQINEIKVGVINGIRLSLTVAVANYYICSQFFPLIPKHHQILTFWDETWCAVKKFQCFLLNSSWVSRKTGSCGFAPSAQGKEI